MIKRRDKIGKAYFAKVLPLDNFAVRGGALVFDDLGARHKMGPEGGYQVKWHRFDNETERTEPVSASGFTLPAVEGYWMGEISHPQRAKQTIRVYGRGARISGVEQTW